MNEREDGQNIWKEKEQTWEREEKEGVSYLHLHIPITLCSPCFLFSDTVLRVIN